MEPRKKYVPPQSKCYVPNAEIKSYQRESILRQTSREKEREVVAPAPAPAQIEEEESEVVMLVVSSLSFVCRVCMHCMYLGSFLFSFFLFYVISIKFIT